MQTSNFSIIEMFLLTIIVLKNDLQKYETDVI